ncbi:MAG TPA: cytochrome c [Bryobacteraceae bacterium]|nr:cytochrome c [Bryobacteraceae bacterium]
MIARFIAALAIALCAFAAEPPKEHVPDAAKGKELFQTCAGCHSYATEEKKFGPALKTLFGRVTLRNGEPASDANVRAIILDGYNRMPSFRYSFKSEEIDDLMAFLQTLNARPAQNTAASDGEKYFRAYCVRCHEHNLEGVSSRVSDAKLRQRIDEGHAGSPALKDWIDPAARAAIVEYAKRL